MQASKPSVRPSRRRHPRVPIHVKVRWHNRRDEGVEAEIYDISAEGLFLVSSHPLPESVDGGDLVWVVIPRAQAEVVLTATVRWRGYHPRHEVPGVGVELDEDSAARIQELFPAAVSMAPDAPKP
jgi:PilZ domain